MRYMLEVESRHHRSDGVYLDTHPTVTQRNRAILVDWIIQVQVRQDTVKLWLFWTIWHLWMTLHHYIFLICDKVNSNSDRPTWDWDKRRSTRQLPWWTECWASEGWPSTNCSCWPSLHSSLWLRWRRLSHWRSVCGQRITCAHTLKKNTRLPFSEPIWLSTS